MPFLILFSSDSNAKSLSPISRVVIMAMITDLLITGEMMS